YPVTLGHRRFVQYAVQQERPELVVGRQQQHRPIRLAPRQACRLGVGLQGIEGAKRNFGGGMQPEPAIGWAMIEQEMQALAHTWNLHKSLGLENAAKARQIGWIDEEVDIAVRRIRWRRLAQQAPAHLRLLEGLKY